jgi:hypothetical protein
MLSGGGHGYVAASAGWEGFRCGRWEDTMSPHPHRERLRELRESLGGMCEETMILRSSARKYISINTRDERRHETMEKVSRRSADDSGGGGGGVRGGCNDVGGRQVSTCACARACDRCSAASSSGDTSALTSFAHAASALSRVGGRSLSGWGDGGDGGGDVDDERGGGAGG